jgi:hypothetical protein
LSNSTQIYKVQNNLAMATKSLKEKFGAAQPKKNPIGVAFGKLGASKGGVARAKKLSKEQRSEIAKRAARARWGKTS